jgi:hypothetical protein
MGLICCRETLVKDYHLTVRDTPEKRVFYQHHGGSLKPGAVVIDKYLTVVDFFL